MASSPQVLFLAPVEPWCRENGSSVIIADMLEGITAVGGVEMLPVFLRHPPPGCRAYPPAGFAGVQLGLEGVPRWVSIAKAIAFRSSPLRLRFDNRMVTRVVLDTVRQRGFTPALVHVEHLPLVDMALAVGRHFGCPVVYRAHNIEAELFARRLGRRGPLANAMLRHVARAEVDAMERCQVTLCISDVDLSWVKARTRTARAELFPCSLLLDRYDAYASRAKRPEPTIGFAGGLDWAPNETGLRWFVEQAFPRVVAAVPTVKLAVLARGAAARPWLTSNPNVRILDDASDAREMFATSWVSIAPLLEGGGVRIKIPESLALGCPVVATTIGAEGHELPDLTRTDDPGTFADACVRHLARPPAADDRRRLRDAVNARHGATVLGQRLVSMWSELIRRGAASAA